MNCDVRRIGKATLRKMILRGLIILIAIYLLCLTYCMVSVFNIQTITYNSTGWGVVLAEYKLNFAEDLAELNYYDFDGTRSAHVENPFSGVQQAKVRFVCAIALMPLWRSGYNNPFVVDGDQWCIIISYENREKATYGSNSYPLTYPFVYHTIVSVFDMMK